MVKVAVNVPSQSRRLKCNLNGHCKANPQRETNNDDVPPCAELAVYPNEKAMFANSCIAIIFLINVLCSNSF